MSGPGAEFTADHLGRVVVLRGAAPSELLVRYARGFLLRAPASRTAVRGSR
ncbi:hypothetical protein [Streptomyces sp. NPDC006510]|uniref:hypothetical protein n=1 Tax=Streptomyces sp. NPDC006510 TaxID=3155600 RepID=UPI0033AED778